MAGVATASNGRGAGAGGPLLAVRDLHASFADSRGGGRVHAVNGVSFDVEQGTTLGLVGESGCGKTTLGRSLLRLVEDVRGSVRLAGVDLLGASISQLRKLRRHAQLVFQDAGGSLDPRMTIGQSVAEPLVVQRLTPDRRERRRQVDALLERVGLGSGLSARYPHELSGGQRQRVAIARAVASSPKLVVCDEPVSALDVSIQSQILNLLRDLQQDLGLTYLFISHDLAVVRYLSDRVAVMYLGRIVEIADTDDIFERARHPYTKALLAASRDAHLSNTDKVALPCGSHTDAIEEPPSPFRLPVGCAYRSRCSVAIDRCAVDVPQLAEDVGSGGNSVACHVPSI